MDVSHRFVLGFGALYYFVGAAFLALDPPGLALLGAEGAPWRVLGLSSLFFGVYVASNRLFGRRARTPGRAQPVAAAYTSSILALSGTALIAALFIGIDGLMITRESARVSNSLIQVLNLHLAGSFLAAVVWGTRRETLGWFGKGVVLFAFVASLAIGVAEGRRTAVALPVLFLLASWWLGRGRQRGGYLLPLLIAGLGVGGVVFTTLARAGAPLDAVFAALALRLFNPAVMLSIVVEAPFDFDPDTLVQVVRRFGSSFLGREYHSLTNDFGVALGILSPSNHVVGINYGVVCEAYLWGGVGGVIFWAFVLERLVDVASLLGNGPVMRGGLIIGLLAAHGIQMEIPYTVIALIKGGLLVMAAKWGILLLSSFWRSIRATGTLDILGQQRAG